MSRNANTRFALNPTNLDISRSKFNRNHSLKTSFNVGDVVPFYVDEVLPGDTFQIKTSLVARMQTLITPMMDNIYLDTYFFFVPNRLTWNHWKEFNGENTQSAWYPSVEYSVPQLTAPATSGWSIGTLADYFGIPTGVPNLSVNALPFRAYALIMNEWFRDENLSDPLSVPVDDATVVGVNTGNYITDVAKGGLPFKAAKYHDYFTSCLPAPQKGPDVLIPSATAGEYPVVPRSTEIDQDLAIANPLKWYGNPSGHVDLKNGTNFTNEAGIGPGFVSSPTSSYYNMWPANLYAVASGGLGATINQLRMAFQIQKLYERDARGGK